MFQPDAVPSHDRPAQICEELVASINKHSENAEHRLELFRAVADVFNLYVRLIEAENAKNLEEQFAAETRAAEIDFGMEFPKS